MIANKSPSLTQSSNDLGIPPLVKALYAKGVGKFSKEGMVLDIDSQEQSRYVFSLNTSRSIQSVKRVSSFSKLGQS